MKYREPMAFQKDLEKIKETCPELSGLSLWAVNALWQAFVEATYFVSAAGPLTPQLILEFRKYILVQA